nr:4'-phosphopantetheinyl transferase superfamily protein [Schlegelella koreensis]
MHEAPGGRLGLGVPVDISVSHADGLVACALSTAGAVGIDVEALGAANAEHFRIYLSEAERAWAGVSPERFLAIWTRKEAVVKAAGTAGLAAVPAVDTMVGPEHASLNGTLWWTPALAVGPGYAAHLALADGPKPISLTRIERAALERALT